MMHEIDPRKLVYFASVVEQGSINKAATAHKISQPAMSTSMDRLESEVGLKLLERGPLGIVATSYGEILYCHARLVREEIELARQNLADALDGVRESIRVGALPSLAGSVIPTALNAWRAEHPGLDLQVVENAQIDLLRGLLRRDFDFVVGFTEVFDILDGLRQKVLFRDRQCVLARPDHPLVQAPEIEWADLMSYPWVAPTSRRTHTVIEHIMTTLNVGPPSQVTVCGTVSLLISVVAESDHLALLPAHAVRQELEIGRLVALPFDDPVLHRNIAMFFREGYNLDEPRQDLVSKIREAGLELTSDRYAQPD